MAEVTITSWLSENLLIDWNRNTTLDEIISRLTKDIPAFKDVCNPTMLTNIIMKIFPNVKKSGVTVNTIKIRSILGITLDSSTGKRQLIPFEALPTMKPTEWFLLHKSESVCRLGCMSKETFNGNHMITELSISNDGNVQLSVAGKLIDLSQFYISSKLVFNVNSINALFRCLKIISVCRGYHDKNKEEPFTFFNDKYVKEVCIVQKDAEPKFVIRHINCYKVVPIGSVSHTCKRCIVCKSTSNQRMKKKLSEQSQNLYQDKQK